MRACKKQAYSHTATGKNFPTQEELLQYSVSGDENESIGEEVVTVPEPVGVDQKLSGSFDSGRMSDSHRNQPVDEKPEFFEIDAQKISEE